MSAKEAKDDDFDEFDEDVEEGEAEVIPVYRSLEAHRRLEDKLEERRLSRLIRDYDFDMDD